MKSTEIFNKTVISNYLIIDEDEFVKDRLDFYERKWDGCGCKID